MNQEYTPIRILINHFNNYFSLTKAEEEALSASFTERKIKRRGFILQQGEVCRYFSFVLSGCFRMYAVDQAGKEYNIQFATENDWIADLDSFYGKKPSLVYIEAVESSTILHIPYGALIKLYTNYHKFDRNFRIIIEKKYIELQNRVLQNISATAAERYQYFVEQYPQLADRLPATQIASYLGITPEFLSKIKNN